MVFCRASSFYPLSSRALESIVWCWRRLCSECLAISWKTQQISAFPPLWRGWDPQPWLLGATSLECGGWVQQQGLRHLLPVNGRPGNCIVLPGMQSTLTSTLYGSFSALNFTAFAGTWESSSMALSKPQSSFVFLLHSDLPATFSEKKHVQPKGYLSGCGRPADQNYFPSHCMVKTCHGFLLQ